MKQAFTVFLGVWALGSFLCLPSLHAEERTKIGFELYSWQTKAQWNYSVFEGTSTPRSAETIRAPKTRLRNMDFLKGRLAVLPPGESVYWREDKSRGFTLPSKELIHEVRQFTESSQLYLVLPKEKDPIKDIF